MPGKDMLQVCHTAHALVLAWLRRPGLQHGVGGGAAGVRYQRLLHMLPCSRPELRGWGLTGTLEAHYTACTVVV